MTVQHTPKTPPPYVLQSFLCPNEDQMGSYRSFPCHQVKEEIEESRDPAYRLSRVIRQCIVGSAQSSLHSVSACMPIHV